MGEGINTKGHREGVRGRTTHALALLLLALLLSLFWYSYILHERPPLLNDVAGDILRIHLPNVLYSVQSIENGVPPLWNPNEFCGMPMFAGLEFGPLYPLNWLFFLVPLDIGHLLGALLHQVLLAAGTYCFLRNALKLGASAALFGALCVALSGWSTFRMLTEFDAYRSAAYIPWALLCAERLFSGVTPVRFALLSTVIALQFLAGETEIWVRTLMLLAAYSSFRILQRWIAARTFRNLIVPALALSGAVLLSVGLVAVQLLPTMEASQRSLRSTSGLTFEHAFRDGIANPDTLLSAMTVYDYPNHGLFFGFLPLTGALYALTRSRGQTWFFLITAILFFALILGDYTVIARLYYALPTGNWFRAPIRFLPYLVFASGVLTGIGAQQLLDDLYKPERRLRRVIAIVPLAILALPFVTSTVAASQVEFTSAAVCASLLVLMLVINFKFKERFNARLAAGAILCAAYLALPVTLYDLKEFNIPKPLDFIGPAEKALPAICTDLNPGDRVYVDYAFETGRRQPKFGTVTGLPAINGVSAFMPKSFWQYIYPYSSSRIRAYHADEGFDDMSAQSGIWGGLTIDSGASEAFRILGVRRIGLGLGSELQYSAGGDVPLPSNWRNIYDSGQSPLFDRFAAYDNPDVWSRAFVVDEENPETIDTLIDRYNAGAHAAKITSYHANRVRIELPRRDGLLVLTDQYYPGWIARIDGEPAPIIPVAGLFRGVRVDSQAREIEFVYRPRSVISGAIVSLASLAALASLLFWRYKHRQPR